MREPRLVNNEIYHVFNRGVDKCRIFQDFFDYKRFYESMLLFNDVEYRHPGGRSGNQSARWDMLARLSEAGNGKHVAIISYCLVPSHFHLMVRQIRDGGISTFLQKLCLGHAHYFNLRHGRQGSLFEDSFQAVLVEDEAHYIHLPRYIHFNALDLTEFDWRNGAIREWNGAREFLDQYPWSSHGRYIGNEQELPVLSDIDIKELFSSPQEYCRYLREWSGRFILPENSIKFDCSIMPASQRRAREL